jgi:hypothetical protein
MTHDEYKAAQLAAQKLAKSHADEIKKNPDRKEEIYAQRAADEQVARDQHKAKRLAKKAVRQGLWDHRKALWIARTMTVTSGSNP